MSSSSSSDRRFPRRPRAHSLRSAITNIPPLLLKKSACGSGPSSDSAATNTSDDQRGTTPTSVHSVPTPTGSPSSSARQARLSCPKCSQDKHVHRLAWWKEKHVYIYSCSYLRPESPERGPEHLCAYVWIESHRTPMECSICALTLHVECHGDVWGYHCKNYAHHEQQQRNKK